MLTAYDSIRQAGLIRPATEYLPREAGLKPRRLRRIIFVLR
ncbi:MAG: hypothetical protein VKK42_18580 [Lyngbya sp.]|nr:hypothetical protein [Lyngbya sp.]